MLAADRLYSHPFPEPLRVCFRRLRPRLAAFIKLELRSSLPVALAATGAGIRRRRSGVEAPWKEPALAPGWGLRHHPAIWAPPVRSRSRSLEDAALPRRMLGFIWRFSGRDQIALTALGLASMPVLYATLELPKRIVNDVLARGGAPGEGASRADGLLALCGLYLCAILANGGFKYALNLYKGRVGERLLRRLRLTVFRRWRRSAGGARGTEVIPLIAQEVEPIGGYGANAFALPVLQGGTLATILVFMFAQDPILAAAAVCLLPLQVMLIPRLQRRVNRLARDRARELRALGGELGDQSRTRRRAREDLRAVASSLKRIERIRRAIHGSKYFIKTLNNFFISLTPFFFYAIGGWLVIEGRLSLGGLVAVLAAHKEFCTPLRELFLFYQTTEDARIRYAETRAYLAQLQTTSEARPVAASGAASAAPCLFFGLASSAPRLPLEPPTPAISRRAVS